jgi:UDP-2,3-diacylglucosamine pyrophosphatase LpxH
MPYLVDTLAVSDVHLGSKLSRATDLYRLLKTYQVSEHRYSMRRLLLLGDIFDDLDFQRIRKYEWELLGLIRQMTDEESNVEVVWLRGNHDLKLIDLMKHLVGTEVYEGYGWSVAGKRFYAMHGDQFDKWILNYPRLALIPGFIYDLIQGLDGPRHNLSRYLKDKSKTWLRVNPEVARGMINYVREKGIAADGVLCGHTHFAEASLYSEQGIWYYNAGCWTGKEAPTYITIDLRGEVQILSYQPEALRVALAS